MPYGPQNPLAHRVAPPSFQMRTELVWEGKYDEYGNRLGRKLDEFLCYTKHYVRAYTPGKDLCGRGRRRMFGRL